MEGVASFVETLVKVVGKVGEELLGKGAGPGGDGRGCSGVKGGYQGKKFAKHLSRGVEGLLLGGVVKAGGSQPAELVEDLLGGKLIADDGTNVVTL